MAPRGPVNFFSDTGGKERVSGLERDCVTPKKLYSTKIEREKRIRKKVEVEQNRI